MMGENSRDSAPEQTESTAEDTGINESEEPGQYDTGDQEEQRDQAPESKPEQPASDEEIARLRDALLRTRAEMDNLVKRNQREMEKARKFQNEALMRDLLAVIDGLEKGLDSADSDSEESHEGLALTHRLLIKTLADHGLEVLDPTGERFDPEWHEAMSTQPSDEAEPDTVLMVLQKGYRLNDRLLRPARVIVARQAE